MNRHIKALIEAYNKHWTELGHPEYAYSEEKAAELGDDKVLEILQTSDEVHSQHECSNRWWEDWSYVVKVGDKYFRYDYAEANRDESVRELGYDWDIDSVEEVIPVKKVVEVTQYHTVK